MPRTSEVPAPVTEVLEAAGSWLPRRLGEVERCLERSVTGSGGRLEEDAESTLASGGKRMRPLLVLICAGPQRKEEPVRAAASVELVHMATLVHDDVLDAAGLRRGKPTVFAAGGRDRAVSAGDYLFSRALALLVENGSRRQIELLTDAAVGLALGELAQRADAFDPAISEARYLERCSLKTGRLFECACLLGAEAGEGGGDRDALARFGRGIGLAFQLLDDVLDVTGPPERTGKARGTDLLDGTVTLPLLLAREQDPGLGSLDLRSLDRAAAGAVCDRIEATGAAEAVRERALAMVADAKAVLRDAGLADEQSRQLELVAGGVVERYA